MLVVPINKAECKVHRNGKLIHLAKLDSDVTTRIRWLSSAHRTTPARRRRPCLWARWTRPPWRKLCHPRHVRSCASSRWFHCTWCQLWERKQITWSPNDHFCISRNMSARVDTLLQLQFKQTHLLYVQTASSCVYGQYRRGMRSGQQQLLQFVRSSSSPICGCSWGLEAYL